MACEIFWMAVTAIASWVLVGITFYLISNQIQISKNDLQVRIQLNFEERFESESFIRIRKNSSSQLLMKKGFKGIHEEILNFFESIGMLLRKKYFDEEMAWIGFGYYAIRYWEAYKEYIHAERARVKDDTLYTEFEFLKDQMYAIEMLKRKLTQEEIKIKPEEITDFLSEECNL
jgi:hypothetical protein